MTQTYNTSSDTTIIFIFGVFFLFIIVGGFYLLSIKPFLEKREYIIMEMNRSNAREYVYWKKKLKRLYLELIPIIGRFFR